MLHSMPISYSDHFMSIWLPVQDKEFATIISVYAPSLQADFGEKEASYHDLKSLLGQTDSGINFTY